MSPDTHQKMADVVAIGAIPANAALWLANIDLVLRIGVSAGSLVLISFAIYAKVKHWWAPGAT